MSKQGFLAYMMSSLFITGSSGLIASHLLQGMNIKEYKNIYCLSRTESEITRHLSNYDNFTFIRGSIHDANLYARYLASTDVLVHLAAATGKTRPEEYFSVNAKGTEFLLKQCKKAGVQNILYVSSIAAKFPNKLRYYYAQSKELGEYAVKSSGLKFTIVRPTIVIDKDAAIWKGLSKLAKLPVVFIFGDGTTKIQPIYVGDLVNCLLSIVRENIFSNETFELGGPEEITFENFLKKIHYVCYGKDPWVTHIPIRPLIRFLSILEKYLSAVLPVSVGQLSAFSNDGTIQSNRLHDQYVSRMKTVDEMLRLVTSSA